MIQSPEDAFAWSRLTVSPSLDRLGFADAVSKEQRPYWIRLFWLVIGENAPVATFWRKLSIRAPCPSQKLNLGADHTEMLTDQWAARPV